MNKEDRGILFKDEYIDDRGILFKDEYRGKRYIVQG